MVEGITFTPSPFLYIIVGFIVGLIAGWAIGFFDSNNRTAKKITAAEKNAEIKVREAEEKARKAQEQIASQPVVQDDPGLLRIKNENGRMMLEMDGTPLSGALSPDKRKRLIDLLGIIRPFLEGGQPQTPPQKPAAPPHTPPTPVSSPQPTPSSRPITSPATPPPVAPVKPTLGAALFSSKKKSSEEERPLASLSIVGQIDAVLQARLMNSPLAGKGIRLHESPEGAVEVYVGLQKFPSVDDVPDEAIKSAIRAAIAEWENNYTPGA